MATGGQDRYPARRRGRVSWGTQSPRLRDGKHADL